MEPLTNRTVIRQVMEKHGFTFSKALGQNFIVNPSVCPRIAEEGGAAPGVGVIEIGAGIGVLTAELARRAEKVVCVEIDSRLLPILDETLGEFTNVTILNEDVMKVDLADLIRREFPGLPVVVCANLPYYITSPILMSLLEQRLPIRSITVMVQREAARRICAQPGTREAGAISAAVRYYSEPGILFPVSRGSFLPAPEVDSSVIRLDVLPAPAVAVEDEALFFTVVRGAFGQRRKTVLNTLSAALGLAKEETRRILEAAGVSPGARAEELTLPQFGAIANQVKQNREA
ncbi:MAG: 16S rRNA (adenine(1518)-N(6)/adenine(1519)-N(6))-dimethyltransferase RsmA [Angelakisella sp.]|jgi:16S rRNA (adenine1518-N6/adenine1519-N6)-dimethyltransferase|nr:16S rRNA (adenine(1518)-N(6)/adenine(1519)-N(6))-dimethyltransferase RsmA [Angelakisella sp.]